MTGLRDSGRSPLSTQTVCPHCDGQGWYVGHEDECYEHGCVCSGVQIECSCQRGLTPRERAWFEGDA